jgi:large subunit ribosomal protein L3
MIKALVGKKVTMSARFNQAGEQIPVTLLMVGPCVVTKVKTPEIDGYWAVQLGFGEQKPKSIKKPLQGLIKKAGLKSYPRFLREVPVDPERLPKVGQVITIADVFAPGDLVKITSISKGKGFAGVIKRWGFSAQPRTHGQSDRRRAPGSIGATTDPGRVWPGKKMPGRMGSQTVTISNLVVQSVSPRDNLLIVKGAVPGSRNSLVTVSKVGKQPRFIALVDDQTEGEKRTKKEGGGKS